MTLETGLSAWLLSKIVPTFAALVGGLSLFLFWTPEKIDSKGVVLGIFLAGAISTTVGFIFTASVLYALGLPVNELDLLVGVGWALGFISVAVLNWIANWIASRSKSDIVEIYKEVKKELP